MLLVILLSCSGHNDPQAAFDHAFQTLNRGDAAASAAEAEAAYKRFHNLNSDWAWKFVILRARALYRRGMYDQVLEVLAAEPGEPSSKPLLVREKWIKGLTYTSLHRLQEAEEQLQAAEALCRGEISPPCADVAYARGALKMQYGKYAEAQSYFESVYAAARAGKDPLWESNALLDLSWSAAKQTHFDEALDWATAAREIATAHNFDGVAQTALGDMGWAYYRLGDFEKAEKMFSDAEEQASHLGDTSDQMTWLEASGYVSLDKGDLDAAERNYRKSFDLATSIKNREHLTNSLVALAFVSEQTGKLGDAKRFADQALGMARADNNGRDEVYPLLVEGRIAAHENNAAIAEADFRQVAKSPDTPVFLKWEAERGLAHLYEDENQPNSADREYRTALSTFEAARCGLHERVDSRLPFLSNAARTYEDYIHFLVAQGRPIDALRVSDYSRARTLAEGLGQTCKMKFAPDALNASEIARRAGGTILFYSLGHEHSYLWAITPREVRLISLTANQIEIDSAVERYRKKLEGPHEILEAANDGSFLYQLLIAPAEPLLKQEAGRGDRFIFIIPDAGLNSLNFETLTPQPHRYWIEDETLADAPSLRLLPASRNSDRLSGKLLLLGDPAASNPGAEGSYPKLPNAALQMQNIEKYFPPQRQEVLAGERASPLAYLRGHPEAFSYIHFVAHGTASRVNPLDSAIILSRDAAGKDSAATGTAKTGATDNEPTQDNSFKLYARDIIATPRLRAQLVTISACYSTGNRTYSGEGLVGLSWAFMRAGAHNVVAALWDVSDASAPELIGQFYAGISKGESPASALRSAKLSLLHGSHFRSPFYWAAFQLYSGS